MIELKRVIKDLQEINKVLEKPSEIRINNYIIEKFNIESITPESLIFFNICFPNVLEIDGNFVSFKLVYFLNNFLIESLFEKIKNEIITAGKLSKNIKIYKNNDIIEILNNIAKTVYSKIDNAKIVVMLEDRYETLIKQVVY